MPRGKAPPFKQRIQAALEAALAAGFARVRVRTRDDVTYDFNATQEVIEIILRLAFGIISS
jgi:hypothetical protein